MPSQLTYPGVYIEEVPSGVRTIVGVSTSVTAFVGRAPRGPVRAPIVVTSYGDYARRFGGLWKHSRLGFAVRDFYLNGGSIAVIVRLYNPAAGATSKSFVELEPEGAGANKLRIEAAEEGLWGRSLRVRVDYDTSDPGDTALFNLTVFDGTTGGIEVHRNVVIAPADHPRVLGRVLENQSLLVRDASSAVPSARPEEHDDTPDPGLSIWEDDDTSTTLGNGSDGDPLAAADFDDATDATFQESKKGIYALEDADIVNLLVIPPYTATEDVDDAVAQAATAYAARRRAMYLIDGPSTWDAVADATGGLPVYGIVPPASSNVALYFPRLLQPDPLKDQQLASFAAAGVVAGVLARTDARRGVWKAPAGLEAGLNGVPALTVPLTDAEIGLLNPLGINSLRSISGVGSVIWGARTLAGADRLASEWKYIPVRRTALFIEESLFRGTQWVVFEPNDEPLWAQIRLNVGTFLGDLFRQGAFQGTTPREAYFVKCDKETTTQSDIDRGIVNIHVGFAPLKPAEFVVIRLQQIAGASAV